MAQNSVTSTAMARSILHRRLARGWYDRAFIRDWTNGPLLVREDNGRLLTQRDLTLEGRAQRYVARGLARLPGAGSVERLGHGEAPLSESLPAIVAALVGGA